MLSAVFLISSVNRIHLIQVIIKILIINGQCVINASSRELEPICCLTISFGAVVAEWLSSWLAEQEDRGSIPGLATWIFRDWLSPASKSRYGWKIAKSTLILKTTNQLFLSCWEQKLYRYGCLIVTLVPWWCLQYTFCLHRSVFFLRC